MEKKKHKQVEKPSKYTNCEFAKYRPCSVSMSFLIIFFLPFYFFKIHLFESQSPTHTHTRTHIFCLLVHVSMAVPSGQDQVIIRSQEVHPCLPCGCQGSECWSLLCCLRRLQLGLERGWADLSQALWYDMQVCQMPSYPVVPWCLPISCDFTVKHKYTHFKKENPYS